VSDLPCLAGAAKLKVWLCSQRIYCDLFFNFAKRGL